MTRFNVIKDRTLKPFNSLLGETFELVTDKYRFVSEQVSHHPPVTAFYLESSNYICYSYQINTAAFNGRNIVIAPKNLMYIILKLPNGKLEKYTWTLPKLYINNLIIGKMYTELRGKTTIKNWDTGDFAETEWKERGWSSKVINQAEATVYSKDRVPKYKVFGCYTQNVYMRNLSDPSGEDELVWEMRPKPENSDKMYNFSHFALQLNYLTEELKERLPPTDSRLRPDQRALENGDMDLAIKEKHRLEENQRTRRKTHEKAGTSHIPAYFEYTEHEMTGEMYWKFNGKYWKDRQTKDWGHLVKIYDD